MLRKLRRVDQDHRVFGLFDKRNKILLDVVSHRFSGLFNLARKLSPHFNAVEVLLALLALVKQTHTAKLIGLGELPSHSLEHELLPEALDSGDGGSEVDSEFAALLVDGVLPLGVDSVLEQGEPVDSLLLAIDDVHVDVLGLLVVEKVVDVSVLQVDPGLRKGDDIVEPRYFAHGILIVRGFVVFPEAPLRGECQFRVQEISEFLSLLLGHTYFRCTYKINGFRAMVYNR